MNPVDSLNPFLGITDTARFYYGLVYDGLQAQGEYLEYMPNLALTASPVPLSDTEMVESDAPYGSVWEYNITPNARWHDGELFTADDVVWNLNLNCYGANFTDTWIYSPYTYFMKYAEKKDADTVRVYFYDRETGSLLPVAYGDFIPVFMVPRHLLSDKGTAYISFQWPGWFNDSGEKIIGTGPFKPGPDAVSEYMQGDHLSLVRNEDYHWFADKGMEIDIDKIIMYFYDDETAMKLALQQNMLDIAQYSSNTFQSIQDSLAAGTLKNIATYSGLRPSQHSTVISFSTQDTGSNKWRLDPDARRALAQAVNKTYISSEIYKGLAQEGDGLISPVLESWYWEPDDSHQVGYDMASAELMLELAGYVDLDDDGIRECTADSASIKNGWAIEGDELELNMAVMIEYPEDKIVAQYLQQQWALIGVDLVYEMYLESVLRHLIICNCYDHPNSVISHPTSDPDPNYVLWQHSRRSFNIWTLGGSWNPEFEENYTASVSTLDAQLRSQNVDNCLSIAYTNASLIVLTYNFANYAWRTDTFDNWGDWNAGPGLRMCSSGTTNALLFNLDYPTQVHINGISGLLYASGVFAAGAALVVVIVLFNRGRIAGES